MKKNILFAAFAAFALCLASCQKEEITNDTTDPNDGKVNTFARVKGTSDQRNTDWTSNISLADLLKKMGYDMQGIDSIGGMAFSAFLNFDTAYAHFTFSQNVEVWGLDADDITNQIQGIDYEYSYDGNTHTGYLVGEDEEGNPAKLTFTYDDYADDITFVLHLNIAMDTNTVDLPLVFIRNE